MKTKIRETISGTEYWDSKEMKTISVPKGEEPDFDLTDSLENQKEKPGDDLESKEPDNLQNQDDNKIDLKSMTIEELKKYAKDHDVEIPNDVKKKLDIIELLSWNIAISTDAAAR